MKHLENYCDCQECGNFTEESEFVGIHDRYKGDIFMCTECYELYISENWPICFVAGYEQEINA